MRRQPRERDLVVDDASDGEVADGVGVHGLEGNMRLARQSVGYRVDLKEGERFFYQAFMRSHIRLTLNHLTYRNPSNSLTEYLDSVASSGIEPLQGDSRFSSLHVDRLPGVVPLVDDDVLVLLRGDVRFP